MQFPVPQFTDVEDKIIGPLTLKQFGIIFGAGVVIFLAYSATKNLPVLIAFAILFGLPALAVAFGKTNGRPVYDAFGFTAKFITSTKVYVFHKEVNYLTANAKFKDAQIAAAPLVNQQLSQDPKQRLREINQVLEKQAKAEKELLGRG